MNFRRKVRLSTTSRTRTCRSARSALSKQLLTEVTRHHRTAEVLCDVGAKNRLKVFILALGQQVDEVDDVGEDDLLADLVVGIQDPEQSVKRVLEKNADVVVIDQYDVLQDGDEHVNGLRAPTQQTQQVDVAGQTRRAHAPFNVQALALRHVVADVLHGRLCDVLHSRQKVGKQRLRRERRSAAEETHAAHGQHR